MGPAHRRRGRRHVTGPDLIAMAGALTGLLTAAAAVQDAMSKRRAARQDRASWQRQVDLGARLLGDCREQWELSLSRHEALARLIGTDLARSQDMAVAYREQKALFLGLMLTWAARSHDQWQEWAAAFSPGEMTTMWADLAAETERQARECRVMLSQSRELLDELSPPALADRLRQVHEWATTAQDLSQAAASP
jgi:hypothetical protein